MLQELLLFAKNPFYKQDITTSFSNKLNTFFKLLLIALGTSMLLLMVASIVENLLQLDMGKHAMDDLFENYSGLLIFFLAVIIAPFFEELLFRGPLVFFKNSKFFKPIFYLFTIAFGFMHISNFEMNTQVLLFSPLLVAPQIGVGFILGFIRVKYGLVWSMALHAFYNMVLVIPVLVMQFLDISFE
ncbi:CPBP family intramembrane metalloprotease [Maribacter sp. SA7]|uniref:CPBP family intramembrane glutamic endopeptidase n=1 Tax=Maribacter zhoushanensis TaxID=3030012 RepID=UPI0023EB2F45|nr:CPBP family intramembrane glutamic endopeptidase [Maribacter zhoushanensis]MDF4203208.1 CPBP family intramembrane metalloprotease [Maribacter zhoushanensis]